MKKGKRERQIRALERRQRDVARWSKVVLASPDDKDAPRKLRLANKEVRTLQERI